jgi:hypothetical protein
MKQPARTRLLVLISFALFQISRPSAEEDSLEKLIVNEKEAQSQWGGESDFLPVMHLAGDQTGILVYQAGLEREGTALVCSDIEFDELMDTNTPPRPGSPVTVNTAIPRVRDILKERCLFQPGDPVLAVGPGWQELVTVRGYEIRRDPGACPNDPPMALWATIDGTFPEPPFFYSTTLEWPTGPNQFVFSEDWLIEPLANDLKIKLMGAVSFFTEYDVKIMRLNLPGCDRLIVLKKSKLSLEDAELPGEILLSEKAGEIQTLLIERVDLHKGSGRLVPIGLLDLNRDPFLDLVVEGVHQGCPYRIIFLGQSDGFEQLEVPVPPCGC